MVGALQAHCLPLACFPHPAAGTGGCSSGAALRAAIPPFLISGELAVGSLSVSSLVFVVILTSILAGTLLRKILPEHHLSNDSKDIVRLGTGLVATLGALVLGLLIASAKSSYDTQSGHIKQITADIVLLDRLLAKYGPEARHIREKLRQGVNPIVARIWGEQSLNASAAPFEASAIGESIILDIQALAPANDIQKSLKSWAAEVSADLAKTRLLLFAQKRQSRPGAIPRSDRFLDAHHIS